AYLVHHWHNRRSGGHTGRFAVPDPKPQPRRSLRRKSRRKASNGMPHYPNLPTGLSNLETSRWAFNQAARVPAEQAIVEIGVYRARTTCWLASGAQSGHGAHVWGVDPWDLPQHDPVKPKFRDSKQRRLANSH